MVGASPPLAAAAGLPLPNAKMPCAFEEELALFRKRQAEPRQVDLRLVGLDLREIGVVGEVGVRLFVTPYFTSMPASRSRSFSDGGRAADRS